MSDKHILTVRLPDGRTIRQQFVEVDGVRWVVGTIPQPLPEKRKPWWKRLVSFTGTKSS